MTKPETCRDVLADMLAAASNMSDLADALDSYGFSPDRIRAAIAADEAERARLRRIEVRQWEPALDYLGGGEYVSTAVEDCDGEYYLVADIAPLLAELATLRERTRRRDAATEPPPEGVWVNGLTTTGRVVVARLLDGDWCDEHGVWTCGMCAWWPLPPTGEK